LSKNKELNYDYDWFLEKLPMRRKALVVGVFFNPKNTIQMIVYFSATFYA
jgi:hypothetical protein